MEKEMKIIYDGVIIVIIICNNNTRNNKRNCSVFWSYLSFFLFLASRFVYISRLLHWYIYRTSTNIHCELYEITMMVALSVVININRERIVSNQNSETKTKPREYKEKNILLAVLNFLSVSEQSTQNKIF